MLVLFGIVAVALSILVGSAQAQSRSWVSGTGNDAYPCSRTSPCKTFAGAISKTSAGGEINCIDAGSYGAVTITKSIIISCEAGTAAVSVPSGGDGITVNVGATDAVYLRGLDIDGYGYGAGANGIRFTGAGQLHVEKCVIRGFASGINAVASGALYVSDTMLDHNVASGPPPGVGITINPSSGPASAVLARLRLTYNSFGVLVDGHAGASPVVSITDSVASNNGNSGFYAASNGGGVLMQINRSTASQNGTGVFVAGSQAQAVIGESLISQNGTGIKANGSTIYSYQNNQINGNATDGTPIPSVALQ